MKKIDWSVVIGCMIALVIWYYVSPMLTTSTSGTTTTPTEPSAPVLPV